MQTELHCFLVQRRFHFFAILASIVTICIVLASPLRAESAANIAVVCTGPRAKKLNGKDFHVDAGGTNVAQVSFSPQPGWTLLVPEQNKNIEVPPHGSATWAAIKGEERRSGVVSYCEHPSKEDPHVHKKAPTLFPVEAYWTEQYYFSQTRVKVELHARVREQQKGMHRTPIEFEPCVCGNTSIPPTKSEDRPETHFNKYTWRWDNLTDSPHSWLQVEVSSNRFNPTFYFDKSRTPKPILVSVLAEWSECNNIVDVTSPVDPVYTIAPQANACYGYVHTQCDVIPDPSIPPYVIPFPD